MGDAEAVLFTHKRTPSSAKAKEVFIKNKRLCESFGMDCIPYHMDYGRRLLSKCASDLVFMQFFVDVDIRWEMETDKRIPLVISLIKSGE